MITIVVGLPASGKTEFIKKTFNPATVEIIDDFVTPDNLKTLLSKNVDCVISDPYFCDNNVLDQVLKIINDHSTMIVNILYFENNPSQCHINSKLDNRKDKIVNGLINQLSKLYYPPEDTIKCYSGNS